MVLRVAAGVDKLKPDTSGWAQINGRDEISKETKVMREKEYLKRWSVWFDFLIVLLNFVRVLRSKGGEPLRKILRLQKKLNGYKYYKLL